MSGFLDIAGKGRIGGKEQGREQIKRGDRDWGCNSDRMVEQILKLTKVYI